MTQLLPRRAFLRLTTLFGLGFMLRVARAMGRRPEFQGVQRLRGEVRVNGKPAQVRTLVQPGDTVTTGADGHVVFVVGEEAFLLRENGRVTVTGQPGLVERLRVHTGRILSVFAPRKAMRQFETATAVIGVRGTGLYIEAETERTYVCTCYGTADLAVRDAPAARETVTTRRHDAPRYLYRKGTRDRLIEPAKVINHTDDELWMLETLVGRVPSLSYDDGSGFPR
jgi:hypothetical protein